MNSARRPCGRDLARHLRLLARLTETQRVEVEVRSLGGPNLEVCVVGFDCTGALAAIMNARQKSWPELLRAHRRDYGALFSACQIGSARIFK